MNEKQNINQKSKRNVLSFFEQKATSVYGKESFGPKSKIMGGEI